MITAHVSSVVGYAVSTCHDFTHIATVLINKATCEVTTIVGLAGARCLNIILNIILDLTSLNLAAGDYELTFYGQMNDNENDPNRIRLYVGGLKLNPLPCE